MTDGRSLKSRLLAWISRKEDTGISFESIALEVFRYQFRENLPYRNYCSAIEKTPANVNDWRQIPALPTDAFKFPAHLPRSFPAGSATKYFLTSGTTTDVRGRHEFPDLNLYEAAILSGWRAVVLPEISEPWFFSQNAAIANESSLVHMFEVLGRSSSKPAERWMIDEAGKIDVSRLPVDRPVQLFSTAIGLLRWMESEAPVRLAAGSWIFETGGYKGLTETMEPEIFRQRVGEFFGISPTKILNEYSMTELSSQFYRWPDEPAHRGPFWTRVRVIDPETGASAAEGTAGYLEIVDLANLGSVAAIRTQDLAIATGDSEFILLGRDPGALPRGCSRASDDLLKKR